MASTCRASAAELACLLHQRAVDAVTLPAAIQAAAGFLQVAAITEAATHPRFQLPAYLWKEQRQLLCINWKLRPVEAWAVSQQPTARQIMQFDMARGVAAALKLARYRSGAQIQRRHQGIEQAALADTTGTAEHGHTTGQALLQRLER